MSFFGNTVNSLERALDYSSVKNKTISNNIANVDTDNYKAKSVVFKDALSKEMNSTFVAKRTNVKHIPFQSSSLEGSFRVVTDKGSTYNHNGNNVDIDKEMTELAENQIYYQAIVDRLNGKFNSLQTVLKGGR
ncbi:flagellar basal body rod protein FlgB [Aquibacillus kalidii]|uniref:flagellar basal body rod protein FlgB n=1 Tax=Aquibacillus kalidii TaxID=2762597 RepID=UPI0016485C46|nr:flagellar basal body rod protein FlgB [Aquibacillus kalidii]